MRKRTAPAKKARKVKHIPAGYHAVTPYLSIRGAARAIEFYKKAFGAAEVMRMPGPDGKLGHAEIRIGDSRIIYVRDVDATTERAVAAGAKLIRPIEDKFYGDRTGSIEDPYGHVWHLATHKEDLSMAELRRRAEKAAKEMGG
jgi:PhnB protein